MGIEVKMEDHSNEVKSELKDKVSIALDAVGFAAESNAKVLCPVDTGRLRGSINHMVDDDAVVIGTNVEYGKYVETNDKARHPNGQAHYMRDGVIRKVDEYQRIFTMYLSR